jgi:hypothetical protein
MYCFTPPPPLQSKKQHSLLRDLHLIVEGQLKDGVRKSTSVQWLQSAPLLKEVECTGFGLLQSPALSCVHQWLAVLDLAKEVGVLYNLRT